MPRIKVDSRIRSLIETGVELNHRTFFFIVGQQAPNQVVHLHNMLSKTRIQSRPNMLWCYSKNLGFSTHRKKLMKKLSKKNKQGSLDIAKSVEDDDEFTLFVAATKIRYCYYKQTHEILGQTYGMCVLQDFEALTPNHLARTIETVEGGGIVCVLLKNMDSLKQIYSMTMDVHSRYRTDAHQHIKPRFNERFILSLATCENALCINDKLGVLPISTSAVKMLKNLENGETEERTNKTDNKNKQKLKSLKVELRDTPTGAIVNAAKTMDQANCIMRFIDILTDKKLNCTAVMTAARGRGKSATLGLAIASAIAFGYSNIFITAPSPENLSTVFEFVKKGLDLLKYEETSDYNFVQSTNEAYNKAIVRVKVFRDHNQTIQYIHPSDHTLLSHCEIMCIDEAAAIPLPLVKNLLGSHMVFMSSTISGYEGTGRSLSLKLIDQLRRNQTSSNKLYEMKLTESIRYSTGDPIESWLSKLLCLEANLSNNIVNNAPPPKKCELFYINRDTLFSYHSASESFLQKLMGLFVSSHYKNSPNDLQLLSDAPAHQIFVLTPPITDDQKSLPPILAVIQVALEGKINRQTIQKTDVSGVRPDGNLIPWNIRQQFQDAKFPELSGARIVRIASHPDFQSQGYGSHALELLTSYYQGVFNSGVDGEDEENDVIEEDSEEKVGLENEIVTPRKSLPPLFVNIKDRKAEQLDWIGSSFGLTEQLGKFWMKNNYKPMYVSQVRNETTGEHTCFMLKSLQDNTGSWVDKFCVDFKRRFSQLLSFDFRDFSIELALRVLSVKTGKSSMKTADKAFLDAYLSSYDIKRLESYTDGTVEYSLIMDLVPTVAKLYFTGKLTDRVKLSHKLQQGILCAVGLQRKSLDMISKEFDIDRSQVGGLFKRLMKSVVNACNEIAREDFAPAVDKRLSEFVEKEKAQQEDSKIFKNKTDAKAVEALEKEFAIGGTDESWSKELTSAGDKVSITGVTVKTVREVVKSGKSKASDGGNEVPKKKKKGGDGGGGGKKKGRTLN